MRDSLGVAGKEELVDQGLVTWVVGIATFVGTMLATSAVAGANANLRLKTVVLTYQQRLQDSYLENARAHIGDVYLPIARALESLRCSYESYRATMGADADGHDAQAGEQMVADVDTFLGVINEQMAQEASAFLTSALEERLRSFRVFLERSKDVDEVQRAPLLTRNVMLPLERINLVAPHGLIPAVLDPMSMFIWGLRAARLYSRSRMLLAAPIHSGQFEQRFIEDVDEIKSLIKEITLGRQQAPPATPN